MMSRRVLKPTTIVPPALYVERAADRQLRHILDDMGRPGYILVARQMGKTNLLLNMKRERRDDIVLYLDLTNRFSNARSWFRQVIDALIETDPISFLGPREFIDKSRKAGELEANVEYDRHIRSLLRATTKKIIIVLDEIDSLVNTPYSDTILAQIRSMYFSRASYAEYERLTYVLSGVVEPTDLIKDKNISPFNIGEKIYLNNFDEVEFTEFINRTLAPIDYSVSNTIFKWAAGNPRITWDICAELETRRAKGTKLSEAVVDEVVHTLYLREFDRAPVDHIRTLALSDALIRGAIVSIRYGKSEFLDQRIRSRLFLSGITNSPGEKDILIANKVVDLALSQEWLDQVNRSQETISSTALENYKAGNFAAAIEQFEKIRDGLEDESEFSLEARVALGMSYLHTDNSVSGVLELTRSLSLIEDVRRSQEINLCVGVAYVSQGDLHNALAHLKRAVEGPDVSLGRYALLEQIPLLIKLGVGRNGLDAIKIGSELIRTLDETEASLEGQSSMLSSALYARARAYLAMNNKRAAAVDIHRAIGLAPTEILPTLFLCEYEVQEDDVGRDVVLGKLVDSLLSNKVAFAAGHELSTKFNKSHLTHALWLLDQRQLDGQFELLIEYYIERVHKNRISIFSALSGLYGDLSDEKDHTKYLPLLARALLDYSTGASTAVERAEVGMNLLLRIQGEAILSFGKRYLDDLEALNEEPTEFVRMLHVGALLRIGNALANTQEIELSNRLFTIWKRYRKGLTTGRALAWSVFMDHAEMTFRKSRTDNDLARFLASEIIKNTETDNRHQFEGVEWDAAITFRKNAIKMLKDIDASGGPLRERNDDLFRGFARNQKVLVQYRGLPPVEKKFKAVEADLRSGHCSLVSANS